MIVVGRFALVCCLVFSLGAGVDHLFADLTLPDAPVVRVVDPDLSDRMSEWVVMHALIHLRQLRRYERQQRERIWADDERQPKAGDGLGKDSQKHDAGDEESQVTNPKRGFAGSAASLV